MNNITNPSKSLLVLHFYVYLYISYILIQFTTTIMVMTMNIPTTVPTEAAAMTPELSANRKKMLINLHA